MAAESNTTEYVINAEGKRLGTIATEAASVLNGKNTVAFAKNVLAPIVVKIENASKMDIPDKKKTEVYKTYSGHPSGQKEETLMHLLACVSRRRRTRRFS